MFYFAIPVGTCSFVRALADSKSLGRCSNGDFETSCIATVFCHSRRPLRLSRRFRHPTSASAIIQYCTDSDDKGQATVVPISSVKPPRPFISAIPQLVLPYTSHRSIRYSTADRTVFQKDQGRRHFYCTIKLLRYRCVIEIVYVRQESIAFVR